MVRVQDEIRNGTLWNQYKIAIASVLDVAIKKHVKLKVIFVIFRRFRKIAKSDY